MRDHKTEQLCHVARRKLAFSLGFTEYFNHNGKTRRSKIKRFPRCVNNQDSDSSLFVFLNRKIDLGLMPMVITNTTFK